MDTNLIYKTECDNGQKKFYQILLLLDEQLLDTAFRLLRLLPGESGSDFGEKVAFEMAPIRLFYPPEVSISRSDIILKKE